ncbi:MAG: RNase adapter RapZ [Betaproteobacteria bacterium]
MDLILISGLSGSGKSVALNMLEDSGYYCVDNLPSPLLQMLVMEMRNEGYTKVAVAVDIRGGYSLLHLPGHVKALEADDLNVRFLFLDAKDETLLKRFSETRRNHPLASTGRSLEESIREERLRMAPIADLGLRIDTSDLKASALREWVRQFVSSDASGRKLTLMFESFGFKHGIPLDADLVFDVRCLPNPHYDPVLKPLTGLDAKVVEYLEAHDEVRRMRDDIRNFVATWLPCYIRDNRNYLTVAIGCTGGQHRSVYFAEWLGRAFAEYASVLVRHRSLA